MTDPHISRRTVLKGASAGIAGLAGVIGATGGASALVAHGEGSHELSGFPPYANFKFDSDYVDCILPRSFAPAGTPLPGPIGEVPFDLYISMDMVAEQVETKDYDDLTTVTYNEGVIGSMYSKTVLEPADDPDNPIVLEEDVPYEMTATDRVLGALNDGDDGDDSFHLTVEYDPDAPTTGGVNQYTLFGSPITFGGSLLDGDVVVTGL